MNKLQKSFLAFSCFLPLYIIFLLKNAFKFFHFAYSQCFIWHYWYNLIMSIIWTFLIISSLIGICTFRKLFLQSYQRANEKVVIVSAENVTKDYYFTYFTLFVLSFFAIDPTNWIDMIVLIFLMILIWIVYLRNNMFFINPVLNIIGYKSFKIKYVKTMPDIGVKYFNAYVFTTEPILRISNEYFLTFSQYDFTICYDKKK